MSEIGTDEPQGHAPPEPDETGFSGIIEEHQRHVYSLALRLTGNAAAADDITQETFISAWKHRKGFRGESSLKTWLLRIAANKARSYWRWKKLRAWVGLGPREPDGEAPSLEELLPDDPAGRPEQAAAAAELERRVQAAISALPRCQGEVAALRAQGVKVAEVAEILGMAEGTVKAHWFEARKKLETALGEYL
ncbi:MAG: hypothetical protein A3J79_05540 [Elusimicrobia bacterium RIFOXYB2_FULL_62_6]|nr:MAG: hypothetical protein A3J79_05540 [Elusimicrobia bacterium RIFOXYB2_FULL_62_6]